jgi:cysteinyl-tRNA synthetase
MSSELLGGEFDLHGGGDDLKFPHHENELAQSEAHGDGFAKRWMHHGLVQYGGKKIAKSDPRMQDVDFEPKNLHACGVGLARLHKQLGDKMDETAESSLDEILARDLDGELTNRRERFCAAMDDDFNTAVALAELFAIEKHARSLEGDARDAALQLMRDLGRLLGLFQVGDRIEAASHDQLFDDVMKVLIGLRTEARERKDFALSDAIRDRLQAIGIELRDGKDGSSWEAGC